MPNLIAVTKKKKKATDKISLLNYSVGSHILSTAHDTAERLLSLECFNMYLVLKLNRLLERKYKSILVVYVVCNRVGKLDSLLFCLLVGTHGTREAGFHSGNDTFVGCDVGWKRCNPFTTKSSSYTNSKEMCCWAPKWFLNIWDSQKAVMRLPVVIGCGKKQWKPNTSKSWHLRPRALRCWRKKWQCL